MKRIMVICMTAMLAAVLVACVPTREDSLSVNPDFSEQKDVKYDFLQLHNDTVELFEGYKQYSFIKDCDIDGNNDDKLITVKATCYDGVDTVTLSRFAAALLRRINDAATIQNYSLTASSSESFGTFWDEFGIDIKIYTESEAEKETPEAAYTLTLTKGQDSGLDPNIEAYEEMWERELEILKRNEE